MKKIFLIIMFVALIACQEEKEAQTVYSDLPSAIVERVVDGDTIVLDSGDKVRFILVNTPESVHPDTSKNTAFGKIASDFTKEHLESQVVYLEKDVSDTDRYGRLLRYVYLDDGTFFNELLVREGYAQVATFPPDVKYLDLLLEAEQYARENELGLWGETIKTDYWMGSKNSDKYHVPYCKFASQILEHNIIIFNSIEEAVEKGYVPCGHCIE